MPAITMQDMTEPIAYSNGQFVPASQLLVQPQDMGFMWGVTVAEQLRTFRGQLFEPDLHEDRLVEGLHIVGIDSIDVAQLFEAAGEVVTNNFALLPEGHDLGVTIYCTPGLSPTYSPDGSRSPNVGVHSYPLPFSLWAEKYDVGQQCEVVSVPQVDAACWPRHLKCRSRMHYYLADREARKANAAARAILLDSDGNVNEASTANVLVYFDDEGLVSPPKDAILAGISLEVVEKIAHELDCSLSFRTIHADELQRADEILLTSTPFCVLPVSRLGGREILQRDCYRWLMRAWSKRVNMDIQDQARRFAE